MASSTMRLSGLISGMDTESIIQQLVSAKQTKVDDAKKAQTKQEWKQTAWKELNTKIKNLQSKFVKNMRFESAYSKIELTKVSDEAIQSVLSPGDGAMTRMYSNLKVRNWLLQRPAGMFLISSQRANGQRKLLNNAVWHLYTEAMWNKPLV